MKTLLALLAGSSLALFLSSCTEYSASGYYNDGYNSSYGSNSGYGYNSAVSVGIIRTSNSYWGYDPYRRSYYDYRTRRYYDQHRNTYCSSPPPAATPPLFTRATIAVDASSAALPPSPGSAHLAATVVTTPVTALMQATVAQVLPTTVAPRRALQVTQAIANSRLGVLSGRLRDRCPS
ncbi:hypothetical protein N9Z45_01870 [Akkermansiaceae bacterium]|nr:hypothetical protein [Akkermansiaceae bacterium]